MINDFHYPRVEFLSNFFPSPVNLDGVTYPTVEHAYQAAKTRNPYERDQIRCCTTPGQAKRMGRTVTLRPDWPQLRLVVMEDLLRQKFGDVVFKALLINTGDEPIIEGNRWHDNFWGACSCANCRPKVKLNHLGKLLMKIRAELWQDIRWQQACQTCDAAPYCDSEIAASCSHVPRPAPAQDACADDCSGCPREKECEEKKSGCLIKEQLCQDCDSCSTPCADLAKADNWEGPTRKK